MPKWQERLLRLEFTIMDYEKPNLATLKTESDVEQKFIYPLLVATRPTGFGIDNNAILTKHNIRKFVIGKGSEQKLYYPDYIIAVRGLPIAVVEGKVPSVDLVEAFREARLYAVELNAAYPSGVNPVRVVCATNGKEIWIGPPDHMDPKVKLTFEETDPYSAKFSTAQGLIGYDVLESYAAETAAATRPKTFFKPRRLIGGFAVQSEEVGQNAFGATLAAELGHIFNPVTKSDRLRIAKDGYVSSPRRERYVDPIDKVIRAATPRAETQSTLVENPSAPKEFIAPFEQSRDLEHRVMLLIGDPGCGKTTFLYHLQAVALPLSVRKKTTWVHIDVNAAPVSREEIYTTIRKELIAGIREGFLDIDFDDLETIQKLYSVEVNRFNKGLGRLLIEGSAEKNHELYKLLLSCQQDLHQTAICLTRYLGNERGSLVVVVFDNSDKNPNADQLLMFEVAQWLQREFRVLVVLPIREQTYESYRDVAPLDTALKDLVFRIEAPVFQQALVKRVQLALNDIAVAGSKQRTYELPNGFKITYAETERSYYITSIVSSIFQYDSYVRRLIMGLAGNNLRRVFETFVEFWTSGHISEAEILRMRQSKGEYVLPLDVVMTVLLRANRRYYDSDLSVLKNLLDLDEKDDRPTYFTRIMILSYLRKKFSSLGPNGMKGYFSVEEITKALFPYGVSPQSVKREINYLAKAECVLNEGLNQSDISDGDLVKIGPVGFVHMELIGVAEYWSAIAEDTNFKIRDTAKRIADRIVIRDAHYTSGVSLPNARAAFEYISSIRSEISASSAAMMTDNLFEELTDISSGDAAISMKSRDIHGGLWLEAVERYPAGSEIEGVVVNKVERHGLFIEIAQGLTGLMHTSQLTSAWFTSNEYEVGSLVRTRILQIDPVRRRLTLGSVSKRRIARG